MRTPRCSAKAVCAIANSNPAKIINFFIFIYNLFLNQSKIIDKKVFSQYQKFYVYIFILLIINKLKGM